MGRGWFAARVPMGPVDDCWEWPGSCQRQGYGNVRFEGHVRTAHRVAFLLWVAPFVGGLAATEDVHHRCYNRRCVNPWHLEKLPAKLNRNGRRRRWTDA